MVYAEHPIAYNILLWVLSLLGTIITSILVPAAFKWLSYKTKNEKLKRVMDELAVTVPSAVSYTNQTFVDQMKADGKFDAEAQKQAMLRATNFTFDTLTASTKRIIEQEGVDINKLVERYIEADIDKQHREKQKNGVSSNKKPVSVVKQRDEISIEDEPVG